MKNFLISDTQIHFARVDSKNILLKMLVDEYVNNVIDTRNNLKLTSNITLLNTKLTYCFQNEVYKHLQAEPDYNVDNLSSRSFDETRRLAARQSLAYKNIELLSLNSIVENFKRHAASTRIMMQFFPDSTIKSGVSFRLFTTAIMNMGTDRHEHFINDIEEEKVRTS